MQLTWNSWTPLVIIPLICCEASPYRGFAIPSHMDRDSELQKRIPVTLTVLLQSYPRWMTAHKWSGLIRLQTHPHFRLPISPSFHILFLDFHLSSKPVRCDTNNLSVWGKTPRVGIYIVVCSFLEITIPSIWKMVRKTDKVWNSENYILNFPN
jgi:hypothetical protein